MHCIEREFENVEMFVNQNGNIFTSEVYSWKLEETIRYPVERFVE